MKPIKFQSEENCIGRSVGLVRARQKWGQKWIRIGHWGGLFASSLQLIEVNPSPCTFIGGCMIAFFSILMIALAF
ncbi:hypothetical protein VNO77_32080 [Canavalia gladiata]|uniref:Uncharacterized protein n=1 Tax=Canavalia gladiata TaxID=3824 RepID=A0AAN9KQ97_CANGL